MDNQNTNISSNRILYFDCLRVFAMLGVMLLHTSASNWYFADVRTFEWQVFNVGDSISRWGVPVFVMISGALFLNGEISFDRICKKHVLRIITAFVFWTIIYALIDLAQGVNTKYFISVIIKGHYHMWFLYMIIGLYLIVPLLRKITESERLTRYFLILSLVFTFIIPQITNIIALCDDYVGDVVNCAVDTLHFHFTIGYASYFVLGYYLNKIDISKKCRLIIYVMALIGFVFTICGSSFLSIYFNEPCGELYGNFNVNILLESLGVFVFFKYVIGSVLIGEKVKRVIIKLSKYSFGAYLVHALILEQMDKLLGINTLMCNTVLAVMIILILDFCVSFAVSWLLNQIPILNRYIV